MSDTTRLDHAHAQKLVFDLALNLTLIRPHHLAYARALDHVLALTHGLTKALEDLETLEFITDLDTEN